ncbi:MAG: amidohydrolase, partial [Acidobacteria bacterium]|nr:amidohydrolase [Acidobacteriota bacterium]
MNSKSLPKLGAALLSMGLAGILLAASDPEIILFNGKIVKVDANFTYAQALAIAEGKILAVGSNQEIQKLAGPATRRIDLGGKT